MLYSIQYLRGIAALLVVYLHTNGAFGHQGVDIFFVVSGFIMTYIINSKEKIATHFFIARLLRISPLYYIITMVVIILGISYSELSISNIFLSFLYLSSEPVLLQGWTLSYEIAFYFICMISIFIFKENKRRFLFITTILIFITIFIEFYKQNDYSGLWIEFVYGIIIYYIWKNYKIKLDIIKKITIPLLTLSLLSFYYYNPTLTSDELDFSWQFIFYGIPSAFFVILFLYLEELKLLPKIKILEMIGDSSYSLYLTHGIITLYAFKIIEIGQSRLFEWLVFLTAILLGFTVYYLLEKPLSNKLKYYKLKNIINNNLSHKYKKAS